MSDGKKNTSTSRRDDEARVSASHLTGGGRTATEEKDEDWGTMPQPKGGSKPTSTRVKDEDLERELEDDRDDEEDEEEDTRARGKSDEEDEDDDDDSDVPPPRSGSGSSGSSGGGTSGSSIDPMQALAQLEQLQGNMPSLIDALKKKREEISQRRDKLNRELDEEEAAIKKRLNFALVLTGQQPIKDDEDDDDDTPPVRRGRRGPRGRRAGTGTSGGGTNNADNKNNDDDDNTPRRAGTGKRFRNDMTLKEAIVEQMFKLPNYTGSVNEITQKVTTEGGYKTTSAKPTNTVRIQMYRLLDEGMVRVNDDGTYRLSKKAVNEMAENR